MVLSGPDVKKRPYFDTPLYPAAQMSVLTALVKYFSWFANNCGVTKEALSSLLYLQHHSILPKNNLLPDSYEAGLKIIKPFLVEPVVYHVCPNDCVLFRKEHADLLQCPVCDAKRYKPDTEIPCRRFTYLPLGPRLTRLYGTDNIAHILQSHGSTSHDGNSVMTDIHHSSLWNHAYQKEGVFNGDFRGISVSFCTDGVNPFSHHKNQYSMWPMVMTILNYPRHIRNKFGNLMLLGIVPANGTKEPDNLNPYIQVVVDELLQLSSSQVYDSYQKAPFNLKVEILLHILDYPGICKVFSITGANALKGCAWCNLEGMLYIFTHVN